LRRPRDADDPRQVLVINARLGPDDDVTHHDLNAARHRLAPRRTFNHHRGKGRSRARAFRQCQPLLPAQPLTPVVDLPATIVNELAAGWA
jgi:hypothetical protein